MLRARVFRYVFAAFLTIVMTSCEKKSGEAVVLAKEHIDAAPPNEQTPKPGAALPYEPNTSRAAVQSTESPTEAESASATDVEIRPMADDEIAVEGYVMKPEVRGTSRDPRALKDEQWLVKVRMLDDGRTFQVPADKTQWEKLRVNDRVKIKYRIGKYTGTVWAAEIE
jgi:hypothetical protein